MNAVRIAALILLLAVLLTICDDVAHVQQGVLSYRDPDAGSLLPDQPTLAVFAGFLALATALVLTGVRLFGRELAPGWAKPIAAVVLFLALYGLTGTFKDHPMALYSAYVLLWPGLMRFAGLDLWRLVVFSVALAVIGPLAEGVRADDGFFAYADVDAFHVPMWLSALYLNGAVAGALLCAQVAAVNRRRGG